MNIKGARLKAKESFMMFVEERASSRWSPPSAPH